jgi:cytochrome b
MTQQAHTIKTRIWDLPTRLFHILLALCVLGLVITGANGDLAMAVDRKSVV